MEASSEGVVGPGERQQEPGNWQGRRMGTRIKILSDVHWVIRL